MGGHPWFYTVPYQKDLQKALDDLKEQEFQAGRYNPVMRTIVFPIGPNSPHPGPKHRNIKEAFEASDADGTRSILDMERISEDQDYCCVTPIDEEDLKRLFGTTKPSIASVEANHKLFDQLQRGMGSYIICYTDGKPTEIYFAGYSFD